MSSQYISYYRFPYGIYTIMILGSISLFLLFHGHRRRIMEQKSLDKPRRLKLILPLNLLLSVVVVMLESGMQYFVQNAEQIQELAEDIPIGYIMDMICVVCIIFTAILFVWLLRYTIIISIRYFPWLIHIMGAILFMVDIRMILRNLDLSGTGWLKDILFSITYYGMGLFLTACFCIYLKLVGSASERRMNKLKNKYIP